MVSKTNWIKIQLILLFLYLVLFPLGQVPRLLFSLLGIPQFHLTDIVIIASLIVTLLRSKEINFEFKQFKYLIMVLIFGFLLSIPILGIKVVIYPGLFYLLRFIAYLYFFYTVKYLVEDGYIKRKQVVDSLMLVGGITAAVGLVQYLLAPDLRSLYTIGWDDHLYRLVSTFLDPTFTGILLTLSILLGLSNLKAKPSIKYLFIVSMSFLALMLTYSRSSYVALVVGVFYLFRQELKNNIKLIVASLGLGLVIVLALPRPEGEGVKLLRTSSIFLKFQNYQESIELIKNSPLFGYGFNNLCFVRLSSDTYVNLESHACSGLDNSILFILATSGVVGLILFVDSIYKLFSSVKIDSYREIFVISSVSVLIHSLFTNTLFYPWVLGWLALLYSATKAQK